MLEKLSVDELVEKLLAQDPGLVKRPGYGELALDYTPPAYCLQESISHFSSRTMGHTIGPHCSIAKEPFASRLGCPVRQSNQSFGPRWGTSRYCVELIGTEEFVSGCHDVLDLRTRLRLEQGDRIKKNRGVRNPPHRTLEAGKRRSRLGHLLEDAFGFDVFSRRKVGKLVERILSAPHS